MYLTQSLHRGVQQDPDAVHSIFGSRTYTHAQTLDRVARIANGLRGLGVEGGDRVAILALNSDHYLQLLMAIPWADAVLVPVNIRWTAQEIAYSLVEAEVVVLFIDDAFAPLASALRNLCPALSILIHSGEDVTPEDMLALDELVRGSEPVEDAQRRGDAAAGIFYTGGTTGFPKGVILSHRNLLTSACGFSSASSMTPRGRLLHAAPVFHLAALSAWVAGSLVSSTHVVVPVFNPTSTMAAIADHHVTDVLLVPTMIQMLVDHADVDQYDLSSITQLTYGASPISESLLDRTRRVLPAVTFIQAYGMTELSPVATVLTDDDHRDPVKRRSAGRAAVHSLVKIVDAAGNELPRGQVGEIVVSGDHVMLGYWKKPQETAEALRNGWMHTGDGAYMDEHGYVFIADRLKDMIISGGENVYSIEVENAIAQHPAVAQVAVVGLPDEAWGERVHAVVVLVPGRALTIEELREHCGSEIARYKCPRSLEIVTELPISGAGKVLKRELRDRHRP